MQGRDRQAFGQQLAEAGACRDVGAGPFDIILNWRAHGIVSTSTTVTISLPFAIAVDDVQHNQTGTSIDCGSSGCHCASNDSASALCLSFPLVARSFRRS